MIPILSGDPLTWSVEAGKTAVAIGVFDGVHRGHQAVMRELTALARQRGLITIALTFDPHPLEFLAPERAPLLLTTVEQRAELLERCGVGVLGVLPFQEIRDLEPPVFAVEILSIRLHAGLVAVGGNFRFGRGRSGDATMLAEVGEQHGFAVEVVDLIGEENGETISSSRIREMLAMGDVVGAARLLGRPFEIRGPIIHGDRRGHEIGFPTANLHVPDRLAVPADGVYAAWASVGDEMQRSVVNIGVRPTFGLDHRTVEAHLMDFEGDLYGRQIALHFVDRLREERRFGSVEELVTQIGRDRDAACSLLEETTPPDGEWCV